VLLPLQRPDLFQSNLLRLNKGILLYGEHVFGEESTPTGLQSTHVPCRMSCAHQAQANSFRSVSHVQDLQALARRC
jgi:hypothetical protein